MIANSSLFMADVSLADHLERSSLLSSIPWIRHGVTRRVPGLGLADGNIGYTAPRDEADAWDMRQRWAKAVGVPGDSLIRVRQLHGNQVHLATRQDLLRGAHPGAPDAPVADAIITSTPGLALTTLHADCLAILLVDPVQRAVAAVHAGWRSTVLDIAGETIKSMTESFGTVPENVLAYVGPSIGVDRYQVGSEVVSAWVKIAPESQAIQTRVDGSYFDLKRANLELLVRAGLALDHIEVSSVCTASDGDNWFSHRGQGSLTGRFAAIIAITGDTE